MPVSLNELISTARVVSIPLRVRFRGIETREALLLEGPNGWAEWSPFLEYPDSEAATWLAGAIEFAYSPDPALKLERVPVNATLPAVEPDRVQQVLENFGRFEVVKIKVAEPGHRHNQDLARIRAVRDLYPEARIRLDANGGLGVEAAERMAIAMMQFGVPLEYFEQPVATIPELAELRSRAMGMDVKIAADESIRRHTDPLEVARMQAADIMVIKAQPLGGVTRALDLTAQAGLAAVVSSALETSVGLAMGAQLASALASEYASGLGTATLLADDISDDPLRPENGFLEVRRVTPSSERLDRLEADSDRRDWWLQRLARAYQLLES